jgi:uncharacterized repeat protein (TIGR01451 family)
MKKLYFFLCFLVLVTKAWAQSEPSTYFNIFVPPNNEAIKRNVALIVTAVSDSTSFSIIDDDMDGDSDDNVSGILMAGQSYILYIKDNGINDDAQYASGGTLTRDGDYFIINSDKLVYASMSTDSDWQHDFVPSVNKKSVGQKFYVYAPKISNSLRDLNVFAYQENTTISIYKISTIPTTQTGYTNINLETKQLVIQRTLNPGQDIIHFYPDGRDLMETGGTYLIESNRNVSVQYGALWGNSRDGGAYVPSSNGSASGELFYFAVPYQSTGEQEIRIDSWDDANAVQLSRFENGNWVIMKSWNLNKYGTADWVGKQNGNVAYPTVFRVTSSPGKRVSVMEANWMETGSTNTSDMSTMLSSESGTSSGKKFLAYMLPPSNQKNVINPFTATFFTGSITHFYLFAGNKNTTVTIKDTKTNGQVLSKTISIAAGRYADAFFTLEEWKSIYNGTGTPSGPDRPYVIIEATQPIAVLSTNFNDNWMNYFGSSLPQSFSQTGSSSAAIAIPGEEITFTSTISVVQDQTVSNARLEVAIASGLIPLSSTLYKDGQEIASGTIHSNEKGSEVLFNPIGTIGANELLSIQTTVLVAPIYNNGNPIHNKAILNVETNVSGYVEGEFQQSQLVQGIQNNSADTSNLLYTKCQTSSISGTNNSSWNPSWIDYNQDGYEDIFIATKDANAPNELFRNNGNGTFTKITNHILINEKASTVAAVWADINNDGRKDVLLVNASQHKSKIFQNNGAGNFSEIKNSGINPHPEYYHGAAFADFDNDGYVDLLMTNFFETRFHQLYRNNGNSTFSPITDTPVTAESHRSMAPILADYDNDGLVDIFIPNGNNRPNSLFKNLGNFKFEKVEDDALSADAKNSVGAAWGDYDNDGWMDLIVVNASKQPNDLYKNLGNGTFQKVQNNIVNEQTGDSHGAAWADLNNDGFLDLYITNDQGASFLYINNGLGNFTRKLEETISGNLGKSYGAAFGDFNKDGHLDLVVSTHTTGQTAFFCHNGSANQWVGFHLQGEYSNKQALGARVALKANGKWQYRQNLPLNGFGSQNSQYIHFGLGNINQVDSVQIHWPNGTIQKLTDYSVNQYNSIQEEAGKLIEAYVFHDLNGDGIKNGNEPVMPNVRLNINKGKLNFASDDQGKLVFRTNEASLEFGLNQSHWKIKPEYAMYQLVGTEASTLMLPIEAVANGYDLQVSVATTAWRRGFPNQTTVLVSNLGTTSAENVAVKVHYPEPVYLLRSDIPFNDKREKVYTWEIGQLKAGMNYTLHLTDSVGLEAFTGQRLILEAELVAYGEDLDSDNNRVFEEVEVVGAIDPNDILVSPKGEGPEGYIQKNQILTYTIRFENIGTYKATYVNIESQLPGGLDLNTFEIVSSSHPFTYKLTDNGKLNVSYSYINLPPALVDSIGAHGYFKYRIKPKYSNAGGTELVNTAKITFDFEEPIQTNTVTNTIKYDGQSEVNSLRIYPNPAVDLVQFAIDPEYYKVTEPQLISYWLITDTSGRTIISQFEEHVPNVKIQVAHYPKGVYFIRAYNRAGQFFSGRLIKQ